MLRMGCTSSKDKEGQDERLRRLEVQLHCLQSDVEASLESEISTIEAALAKISAAEPEVPPCSLSASLSLLDRHAHSWTTD